MHEYLRRLLLAFDKGLLEKESFGLAEVLHDDWCQLFSNTGPECNCDPEIRIKLRGRALCVVDKKGNLKKFKALGQGERP